MKVGLVLHGLVGSITGKNYQMMGGSDKVLEHSSEHNIKNIINQYDTDVYVHTWSVELEEQINEVYKPVKMEATEQIQFEVPDYIKADHKRAFAHLSRWYSFMRAVDLISSNDYTHIIVQRFDLVWNVVPKFEEMDPNYVWTGIIPLNHSYEWCDRWICSSYENMKKFATLYEKIPSYMATNGDLPSSKQYGGI